MRLLFIHQNFGAFGGAETNIQITADELMQRGHLVALMHTTETGRSTESWERTFSTRFRLPVNRRGDAVASALDSFSPDIIYLHACLTLTLSKDFWRRQFRLFEWCMTTRCIASEVTNTIR